MKQKLLLYPVLLASCLVCAYFSLYNIQVTTAGSEIITDETVTAGSKIVKKEITTKEQLPLVVFLVSQCRSGSSILGEMFNRRRGVLFFYEPLYPFRRRNCLPAHDDVTAESIQVTRDIAHCRFANLTDLYRRGYEVAQQDDFVKCLRHNICFYTLEKAVLFMRRDAPEIDNKQTQKVDLDGLSQFCRRSEFVGAKLNYLRGLENLTGLLPAHDSEANVKIIHLVRDPRASTISQIGVNNPIETISEEAKLTCDQILENFRYAEDHLVHMSSRFIRVRYEDFAMAPINFVEDVYKFIGKPPTMELLKWFREATARNEGSSQATQRDSKQAASAWRTKVDFAQVDAMQRNCAEVLTLLGYRIFENEAQLKDIDNISSF